MDKQLTFLDQLFAEGLLIETGVPGLYGRNHTFEKIVAGFERAVAAYATEDQAESVHFPPGMSRNTLSSSGYLKSFPQLAGTVHSFCGSDHDHGVLLRQLANGEDWTQGQVATDLALTPAACYPLYPMIAARGRLKETGALFDLQSYCFRHEPSEDPARMQLFRMREYVRAGTADQVLDFRETWLERGRHLMTSLELPFEVDLANDPFFGRGGKIMASGQREQGLKFELLVPIANSGGPTACLSFNYHQDHFGKTWGIETSNGETAHTACVGFGLERVTLALLRHHGFNLADWPSEVRGKLGLG
ncbi:MAG: amino acid--[acyl-carrier-protein] ligase [Caulobacteraceae bacterium]